MEARQEATGERNRMTKIQSVNEYCGSMPLINLLIQYKLGYNFNH